MDWIDRLGLVLGIAFVVGVAALIVYAVREDNRWSASCEARGGVPFSPRGDRICLDSAYVK